MIRGWASWLLFFYLSAFMGCQPERPTVVVGKTTEAELVERLGSPSRETKHKETESKTLYYQSQQRAFQIYQGRVNQIYREPSPSERSLKYWVKIWQGKPRYVRPVKEDSTKDKRYQVYMPHKNISILIDQSENVIFRVIEHEDIQYKREN